MFKITYCLRRLPNMSRQDFQKHWREVHGPLVVKHKDEMGIRRYVQTHPAAPGSTPALDKIANGPAAPDGVAELWYDSYEAYARAFASPRGKEIAKAFSKDSALFIDFGGTPLFGGQEVVFIGD